MITEYEEVMKNVGWFFFIFRYGGLFLDLDLEADIKQNILCLKIYLHNVELFKVIFHVILNKYFWNVPYVYLYSTQYDILIGKLVWIVNTSWVYTTASYYLGKEVYNYICIKFWRMKLIHKHFWNQMHKSGSMQILPSENDM